MEITAESSASIRIPVHESSQVGEARRNALELARKLDFGEVEAGNVSVIATEAANNLVKHAQKGQILLRPLIEEPAPSLEILALDGGPGMTNVARCLEDGYSTAGSPGTGLGAIARLSHTFDLFSQPPSGSALVSRLSARSARVRAKTTLEFGAICAPLSFDDVCGDAWSVGHLPGRTFVLVADGLGHGVSASEASQEAVRAFRENLGRPPGEIIHFAHGILRATRGAAIAVAELNLQTRQICFAGIGNIAVSLVWSGGRRGLVSHNGTVGHQIHKIQEFTYPWPPDALLVFHSDGLQTRWDLGNYPGLLQRHPSLIAGVLYRDFQRGRDDVTVLALRETPSQS